MEKLELIITSDGSHSLINHELDETYHSRHGAIQESIHVFIAHGLNFLVQQQQPKLVRILEVGFGTGLNALLTAIEATKISSPIAYHTLEAFPVPEEIWSQLNYSDVLGHAELFEKLHRAPWAVSERIHDTFELHKFPEKLQDIALQDDYYDLIYFDAFAPNKQSEMWELSMLQKIALCLKKDAIFVTYCAKGQLKRDLRTLFSEVETLPGPPGKKEMIRARKVRRGG